MKRLFILFALVALTACQPTPSGGDLTKTIVARKLEVPWDLTFAPDGTLYFTERIGNVRTLKPGDDTLTLLSHKLNIRVQSEGGLLGIALDPQFSSNAQLYLC